MSESPRLAEHYTQLEKRFSIQRNPDYEALVVPSGNADEPVHRWFHVKEAYSFRLLPRVLKDLGLADRSVLRLLDPFAGGGTTLVSACQVLSEASAVERVEAYGIETNPWLHLVSGTKFDFCRERPSCAPKHLSDVLRIAREKDAPVAFPELSTFRREDFISANFVSELVRLKTSAEEIQVCEHGSSATLIRRLSLLLTGACVEPATNLRRDGRALRFESTKNPRSPFETFERLIGVVEEDLKSVSAEISERLRGGVVRGDSRQSQSYPANAGNIDLAIFSPPYPNNIDYTEIYKLENWGLGLIANNAAFRNQRLATLRSHPSIKFPEEYPFLDISSEEARGLVHPILAVVPSSDRYKHERKRLILGYLDDMAAVVSHLASRLKPGGWLVCVVGNSMHGSSDTRFTIASDILIASLAARAGLLVERIDIARYPSRRASTSPFLRESLVYCRKPGLK